MRRRFARRTTPFLPLAVITFVLSSTYAEEPPADSPYERPYVVVAKPRWTDAERAKLIAQYEQELHALFRKETRSDADDERAQRLYDQLAELERIELTPDKFAAWRKQYGFQSLEQRLDYERRAKVQPQPKLGTDAAKRLDEYDENWHNHTGSTRAQSLRMLHTMEVEEFAQRSGFGISRMPKVGVESIENKEPKPIAPDVVTPLSTEELNLVAQPLPKPGEKPAPTMEWMPTLEEAILTHDRSWYTFSRSWNFGWVKDLRHVAGFAPHRVSYFQGPAVLAPPHEQLAPGPANGEPLRWKLTRLELVSLLKHETPRVYLSEHLPRMDELSSAKTRALDEFESRSITQLLDGEDVQTAATPNRIVMFGAIRASKQCLQCHEVPRGTLLGAFSYELRRDPPMAIEKSTAPVQ